MENDVTWTEVSPAPLRTVLLLRASLIVATSYLLLAELGFRALPGLLTTLIGVGVASVAIIPALPRRWLTSVRLTPVLVVADTAWVTAALLASRSFDPEFFYLYFFVLFLAGMGENLRLILLGSVVVGGSYLLVIAATGGTDALLTTSTLIRVPFLFTVALSYGYLVDRLRSARHRATLERRTSKSLADANLELTREIAERQGAESELRIITRAVEQSPNAVLVLAANGRIRFANRTAQTLAPGFAGANIHDLLCHMQLAADDLSEFRQALDAGVGWEGELHVDHPSVRWLAGTLSPVVDPEGERLDRALVLSDVTHRKEAEETLRRANRELQAVSELKSELVATVSHELRNPLTALKNAVDILATTGADLSEQQEQLITIARRNVQRLKHILNDLLDLAKIEAGRLPFTFGPVNPTALLGGISDAFAAQAEVNQIHLKAELAPHLPVVWADERRTEQVVFNLLSNALKFTPRRGTVTLHAATAGEWLEIVVADTGPGMEPGDLERVFEPFFQAGDPLTQRDKGSGLGLAIARDLVRAHGSDLHAESSLGKGSRFRFCIPVDTPGAREALGFEATLRDLRRFPFFSLLILELSDREGRRPSPAISDLQECLERQLPRTMDLVIPLPEHNRIAVLLPTTDRAGGSVVRRKLLSALEVASLGPGISVTCFGPAFYPEDGATGLELVMAAERVKEEDGDA